MGSALSDTTYAVIYDLHSHTQASDGLLTPEALVHRAVEMRVGTLAITDHDTTDGIPAARAEIARVYALSGDVDTARAQFDTVLQDPSLPDPVRQRFTRMPIAQIFSLPTQTPVRSATR